MKHALKIAGVSLLLLGLPVLYFSSYLLWPCDQRCTPMEQADQRAVENLFGL